MKRNNPYHLSGKFFLRNAFLATMIFFVSGVSASAQETSHQLNFKNGSITYHGAVGEELIFSLQIENNVNSKIIVAIINAFGERIFNGNFKEKTISKNFKVSSEAGPLTFIITNPADKSTQQFKINSERKYVEDISVTRIL